MGLSFLTDVEALETKQALCLHPCVSASWLLLPCIGLMRLEVQMNEQAGTALAQSERRRGATRRQITESDLCGPAILQVDAKGVVRSCSQAALHRPGFAWPWP